MKCVLYILFLLMLGSGCGTVDSLPTEDVATAIIPITSTALEAQGTAINTPTVEPEEVDGLLPEPAESVVPTALQATITPVDGGEANNELVEAEATEEVNVVFNGIYENSYFRGAENAPVTIIDHSDFL